MRNRIASILLMDEPKKKRRKRTGKTKVVNTDRHKPRVIIAIPSQLAEMFHPLAERRMRSLSKQVIDVLLEYAEQHGLVKSSSVA